MTIQIGVAELLVIVIALALVLAVAVVLLAVRVHRLSRGGFVVGGSAAAPPGPPPGPELDQGVARSMMRDIEDGAEIRELTQGFPPPRDGYQPDGDGVPTDPPRGGTGARPPDVFVAEYDADSEGSPDRASDHTGGGRR